MSEIKKFKTLAELETFKQEKKDIWDFPYEYVDAKGFHVVECVVPCPPREYSEENGTFKKRVY